MKARLVIPLQEPNPRPLHVFAAETSALLKTKGCSSRRAPLLVQKWGDLVHKAWVAGKAPCWAADNIYRLEKGMSCGEHVSRDCECSLKHTSTKTRDPGFKRCPKGTVVQSLVFSKEHFLQKADVLHWIKKHHKRFHSKKIHPTEKSFRVRQLHPGAFVRDSFRIITLTTGVRAVIGCPRMSAA